MTRSSLRADDRIVGFAHIWRDDRDEIKFFARSHPDERGRGVGALLLQLCEQRASQLPATRLTTTTWAADTSAPSLLVTYGYRPVRYFMKMEIGAADVPSEPSWPLQVDRSDLASYPDATTTLFRAWSEAFAGHWGQADDSEAEFWNERRDSKIKAAFPFDPTLWLVALRDGSVIGFCLCEMGTGESALIGRISEVGVVPAHRGNGLGYALLVAGLHELRGRGARSIVLACRRRKRDERRTHLREGRHGCPSRIHDLGEVEPGYLMHLTALGPVSRSARLAL